MLTPDTSLLENGAIIIGGNKNDPREVNLIEMIEKAKSKSPELLLKKKLTSGDEKTLVFAKCEGVVRWTYLLSVLSKWRASQDGKPENANIRGGQPNNLLVPDPLDYLVRPKSPQGDIVEELCQIPVQDTTKMRRLLHELAEANGDPGDGNEEDGMSWQEVCKKSLEPRDRWIMRCNHQTLWPYQEGRPIIQETTVYPDVFPDPREATNDLSSVDPYDFADILSVLPLLRIAGASVGCKFGARITHVLCGLQDGNPKIAFENVKPEHFTCPERGQRLCEAIKKSSLFPDDGFPELVSPEWVRSEVWDNQPGREGT